MPRILWSCLFPAAILWCILVLTCLALYKQRSVQSSCFLLLARLLPTFNSLSNAEDLSSNKNFSALSFLFSSLSWILFPLRRHSPEQYRKRSEMKARYLWIDLSARSYRARSCCVYDITILAPVAKNFIWGHCVNFALNFLSKFYSSIYDNGYFWKLETF